MGQNLAPRGFFAGTDRYFGLLSGAIATLSSLLYGVLFPHTRTGIYNDDAVYVIVARDFWNTATSHPLLGIKPDYPLPGLPLLLAPVAALAGRHWTILEWLPTIATFASVLLFGKLARRWLSAGETLAALALYAFNPVVARFSGIMMPAAFYTCAVILSFRLLADLLDRPTTSKAVVVGFVAGWGSLLRPEGVVLLIGVLTSLLMNKRARAFLPKVALPVIGWALFVAVWFFSRRTATTEFGADISALLAYWPRNFITSFDVGGRLIQVFLVGTWTSLRLLPTSFAFYLSTALALAWVLGIVFGFRDLWKSSTERSLLLGVGLFGGLYFAVHVLWHVALARYFVPLVPFAFLFVVRGIGVGLDVLKHGKAVGFVLLGLLFFSYGYENIRRVYRTYWVARPWTSPPWNALDWVNRNVDPSSIVLSNIAATVDLYTGRQSVGADTTATNVELFVYYMRQQNMSYVVIRDQDILTPGVGATRDPNAIMARYRRWIHLYPRYFLCVFDDPAEQTRIYQIVAPPGFMAAFDIFAQAVADFNAHGHGPALEKARRSVEMEPMLGCAWNLLGILNMVRGYEAEAELAFVEAARLLPDSFNNMLNLATLYHRRGDTVKTQLCLKKGSEISRVREEQPEYDAALKKLLKLWEQGRSTLFVDAPKLTNTR